LTLLGDRLPLLKVLLHYLDGSGDLKILLMGFVIETGSDLEDHFTEVLYLTKWSFVVLGVSKVIIRFLKENFILSEPKKDITHKLQILNSYP